MQQSNHKAKDSDFEKSPMNSQLAMVFPGQGSQSIGMLTEIASEFPEVQETFLQANDVLHQDLWQLIKKGPKETLDQTINTQPALLACSYAIWQILFSRGIKPALLAGHSLGEYTALTCAGALNFADALLIVAARGKYMQEAVPTGVGAMAAIVGLEDDTVKTICQLAAQDDIVSIANFNSLGQVVIAGHAKAVERAIELAKEKSAKMALLIPVSVPSHCLLMRTAAQKLEILLNKIKITLPHLPVINNIDAIPYTTEESIRLGLVKQLYTPVRWVDTIQYFSKFGINQIIECGPGKVLTGLIKRIDKSLSLKNTFQIEDLKNILQEVGGV